MGLGHISVIFWIIMIIWHWISFISDRTPGDWTMFLLFGAALSGLGALIGGNWEWLLANVGLFLIWGWIIDAYDDGIGTPAYEMWSDTRNNNSGGQPGKPVTTQVRPKRNQSNTERGVNTPSTVSGGSISGGSDVDAAAGDQEYSNSASDEGPTRVYDSE